MIGVLIAVAVVGVLFWFFLAPAGPAYERSRPISAVRDALPRLAMMGAGSSLTVRHDRSRRSFSFVKAPDDGGVQQTIVFVVTAREWPSGELEAVSEALRDAPFVSSHQLRHDGPDRALECAIVGQPVTMEYLADELVAKIRPALALDDNDTFTLCLEGPMNYAIWRRVNVGSLQAMGEDNQHWIMKRFARWHLKKHESERRDR